MSANAQVFEILGRLSRDGRSSTGRVDLHRIGHADPRSDDWWMLREETGGRRRESTSALVAMAQAGENGRFAFSGLELGYYVLSARTDRGEGGDLWVTPAVPGQRLQVVLDLEDRSQRLQGRVTHPDGRPWTGTVLVSDPVPMGWEPRLALPPAPTDSEGRFAVSHLPARTLAVCAIDANGTRVRGPDVSPPGVGEYRLTFRPRGQTVTGRVVDAAGGAPVPGAIVEGTTAWFTPPRESHRTIADAQGSFRVVVPAPNGRVRVRASGFAEEWVAAQGRATDHLVRLARTARVRGRVVAEEGCRPVGGTDVRLVPRRSDPEHPLPGYGYSTTSGVDGRYEFDAIRPGEYLVTACGAGWVSSERVGRGRVGAAPRWVRVAPGSDTALDVTAMPAVRVEGRLLDASGAPVVGALVQAAPHVRLADLLEPDALPFAALVHPAPATGADGAFALESLVPAVAYEVSARPAGLPATDSSVVVAGQDPSPIVLRVPASRWVEVRVLDATSDEPIRGARVKVMTMTPPEGDDDLAVSFSTGRDEVEARTDTQGRARVGPVGPGSALASVRAPGYAEGPGPAPFGPIEATASDLSGTIRLARALEIAGRALLPDGTPAVGATIQVGKPHGEGGFQFAYVATDERGEFRITGLGAGRHTLASRLEGDGEYAARATVAAGATDVVLRLTEEEGRRCLRLRVLGPDGEPVPSAEGWFQANTGNRPVRVTDGRAEIEALRHEEVGEVTGVLVVEGARGRDGALLPFGAVRIEGVTGGRTVEVRLPPERAISGRVVGPDGSGVAGVRVRASAVGPLDSAPDAVDAPVYWRVRESVLTDAMGDFRIGHLGSGAHAVLALPPPEYVAPPPACADAGSSDVRISLRSGVDASLSIVGPDGEPVAGARVVVQKAETDVGLAVANLFQEWAGPPASIAGPDGCVRLRALDGAAAYVLGVRGPSAREDLAEHVDTRWRPKDATLRLGPGGAVAGVVRDPLGQPVAGAFVECGRASDVCTTATTAADGRFRFGGLPQGHVHLSASRFDVAAQAVTGQASPRSVAVGTDDAVLVLRPTGP